MRNDTYDELDDIPSVVTSRRERGDRESSRMGSRYDEEDAPVKGRSSGVLWAIVVALLITLGVLGWWSYRQIAVLEQQLVATQESFARISEEAAGRIQDISGKVVANESNVSTGSEALQGQVRQLQRRLADMGKQQQALIGQLESMVQRMDSLSGDMSSRGAADDAGPQVQALASQVKQLSEQSEALASQQKTLASEQAELKQTGTQSAGGDSSAEIEKLNARMNTMATDLNKLRDRNPNYDIQAIRQDITVLRSQLENRNNAEFDAFRGQMTRNINSLQGQLQSLQQQINAR
ncbi:ATPase [Pseudomonas matsuisoli]|uniref:ATPase n=1 Tax=Pseudomonas matsuisoli TaxID=1515666 RepID=A0A917PLD0_9PSED|nr:ATPase [Pseudomonas matsuisoli]GGJ82676.1 ATPase [Pseudomonas matsuisoli]